MLFNSYPFVFVFLPLVLAGFALLARWRARQAVLAFLIVGLFGLLRVVELEVPVP